MKPNAAASKAESKQLTVGIPGVDNILNIQKKIGSGTFSTVYLASLKSEAQLKREQRKWFAVKRLIPTSSPKRIEQELKCLVQIGGLDNVGGIEACVRHHDSVAFIMQYLAHDKFHEYFDQMDVAETRLYLKNLLMALRRVHSFKIIHRDVKPSNFLYNRQEKKWMLVDFGLAQEVKEIKTESAGTSGAVSATKRSIKEVEKDENQIENKNPPSKRIRIEDENKTTHDKSTITSKDNMRPLNDVFKSPLKTSNISNLPTYFHTPLATAVKSTCLGLSVNFRMMDQNSRTVSNPTTPSRSSDKSTAVCYCYGKSQVCNICIVKKEIQASRAGTPGYRPPEVLLKYPNQTTAVDIWSAGIIFLSIISKSYPFFKAHDDFNALAELITLFGDKKIKQLALSLDRHLKIGHKRPQLNLKKLCMKLRNRNPDTEQDSTMTTTNNSNLQDCLHCQQKLNNCLCASSAADPELNDDWPKETWDLLSKMLELDPRKRITAEEALKHPFFTAYENEQ